MIFGELAGAAGAQALAVATNVANPAGVAALFDAIRTRFGRIDLAFNNAGLNAPGTPFEDLSYEKWAEIVGVNLTGSFLVAQAAFRMMKEQTPQGGRIINNGSISAHAPRPDSAPYTATKHAVTGLTKSISLDGRKYDIACGQIDIGNAATPMTQRMQRGVKQADGEVKVEPTMNVDNVATTILFMDSLPIDANVQFVTAITPRWPLTDGGWAAGLLSCRQRADQGAHRPSSQTRDGVKGSVAAICLLSTFGSAWVRPNVGDNPVTAGGS